MHDAGDADVAPPPAYPRLPANRHAVHLWGTRYVLTNRGLWVYAFAALGFALFSVGAFLAICWIFFALAGTA